MLDSRTHDADSMQAWVRSQRLPINGITRESRSPEKLAEEISLIANLKTFDSLVIPSLFLHRSSMLLVGDIAITAAAFMPQCGETEDAPQALVELPLSLGGHTRFWIEGRSWDCIPDRQGLFLPGQRMRAETRHSASMLGFNVDPTTLAVHLEQMAPERFPLQRARQFVQQPHIINLADPRVSEVVSWLLSFLKTMGGKPSETIDSQAQLIHSYEQMLYRATCILLCPELMAGRP